MPAKKNTPKTEQIRASVPMGMKRLIRQAALETWDTEGKEIEEGPLVGRMLALQLAARWRCPSCVAGVPCKVHGPEAVAAALTELGLVEPPEPAEPVDPNGEHRKLLDQWWNNWKGVYGRFPSLSGKQQKALKVARSEHGFELLSEAFDGAFAQYRETGRKNDIPTFDFVLANPSKYAAMKSTKRRAGTLQEGPDR